VLTQSKVLADRHGEITKVDQTLSEIRKIMGFKEFLAHHRGKEEIALQNGSFSSFDPPSPMMSDGHDEW
ncbi:MAG: hypothetical protein ACK8QZ_09275, partial [Anaerolineales bacterium]